MTRHALAAALIIPLAVAACSPQPPDFSYIRSYDPLYYALSSAQRNLQDLSQYRGRPAQAALALGQYEFIVAEMNDRVANLNLSLSEAALVTAGQREIRTALGMPANASARSASAALRRFAYATGIGDTVGARQALSDPVFTFGPQRTLAVLTDLPSLYAVESAAASLTRAAGNMSDFTAAAR